MRAIRAASFMLIALGSPTVSQAQEAGVSPSVITHWLEEPPFWRRIDEPVEVLADGSFSKTHDDQREMGIRGGPVVNVGGGVVAQKLTDPLATCGLAEELLVVGCRSRESALFEGRLVPFSHSDLIPSPRVRVELIQPPYGPIALTPGVEIQDLVATASAAGIDADPNVVQRVERPSPHNRWDPFFGCTLFCPEPAGATP